jgi:hypothetical protein
MAMRVPPVTVHPTMPLTAPYADAASIEGVE